MSLDLLGIATVVDECHYYTNVSLSSHGTSGVSALLSATESIGGIGKALLAIPNLVTVSLKIYKARRTRENLFTISFPDIS
jgi:hypothetical protein